MSDVLGAILIRKASEVARRKRRCVHYAQLARPADRIDNALRALRRDGAELPRVIAEVKLRSPSEGEIRSRHPGVIAEVARAYEEAGAAAISVLADGPGFGGSVLDVRRAAGAVQVPVLFKEFVLDPVQIDAASAAGASLVLLLVRALPGPSLAAMVAQVRARGLEPVVEAADDDELARALDTNATIVGVNARDLRTFRVDPAAAARTLGKIPESRIAVYMSGVRTAQELRVLGAGRADAVLVGTSLCRAPDPGAALRALLGGDAAQRGGSTVGPVELKLRES